MGFSCLQVVQMELVGLVTFRLSHGAHPSCFWVLCSSLINSESTHGPRLQTCPERRLGKLEDLGIFGGCWVRFLVSIPFLTHPGSPLVQSWVGNWCQEIFLSKCPNGQDQKLHRVILSVLSSWTSWWVSPRRASRIPAVC